MPNCQLCPFVVAQRAQLKIQKLVDVQRASLVVCKKLIVSRFKLGPVQNAFVDQELRPSMVGVNGQQGVVQVKQCEFHILELPDFLVVSSNGAVNSRSLVFVVQGKSDPARPSPPLASPCHAENSEVRTQ